MGLDIYFYDKHGEEVESQVDLKITHNLNTIVEECGKVWNRRHYELIWRPDELFGVPNGKVPVRNILLRLPTLIEDLIDNELELRKFLPQNGWGTYEGLISFLCDYLKECYKNKNGFVYCCR